MTGSNDPPGNAAQLRLRAEDRARETAARVPENLDSLSLEEIRRMLHELRVHQVDLEIQNEELRRAQLELDVARARYFSLYDLAPVGYCTLNEQGLILEANLTAALLLGMARGALVNRPISRFIVREHQDRYYLHHRQIFSADGPVACEMRMAKEDGTAFWARLEASVAEDADGAAVSRVVISNITERKRAEEEKARLEEQLRQAQKMESIGRLAGGVAHDFNNLLTVINGYSEMLLLDNLSAGNPLRADLESILAAGQRAAGLTRQLLAFSRKQVLLLRRLDVNRVVEGMRPMLERLVGEDVELRVSLQAESGTVHADPHQLEQVIMNLAVNARNAMPGGGKLLIETACVERNESGSLSHPEARAGSCIMLAVSDNGVGMDEETKNRIFEPFFTTREVGKGTGLGLSMVQGIVAQSGGYIEVRSEPGQGSTFRIYLPALAGLAADDERSPAVAAMGGNETVLVAEDQAEVRKYTVAVLNKYGYRVIQAESAVEALLVCGQDRGPIDLLLTDVVMPNASGRELADKLKILQPGIKVLFMSGYSGNIVEGHGVLARGLEFIQKPFSPEDLARKIRAMLGDARERAAVAGD